MLVRFSINYETVLGRRVFAVGDCKELGKWKVAKALKLEHAGNSRWEADLEIAEAEEIKYKYLVANEDGSDALWERGDDRVKTLDNALELQHFIDSWHDNSSNLKAVKSSAFTDVIFRRAKDKTRRGAKKRLKTSQYVTFKVYTPKISVDHKVCIVGSSAEVGEWDNDKALIMKEVEPFTWELPVEFKKNSEIICFKYGIYDTKAKSVLTLEAGSDRVLDYNSTKALLIERNDELFNYTNMQWRGTGVVVPVFSLRSSTSMGVGEFKDIRLLVDWCKLVGINMIQVLPVNDTVSTHTWVDSYPYSGISVTALHPIYINIDELGELPFGVTNEILKERAKLLNSYDKIDYEAVMNIKSRIYKMAYDVKKKDLFKSKEYKEFFEKNRSWLVPYAAYSFLRDLYGTAVFTEWGKYADFDQKVIDELVAPDSLHFDEIAVHYYIQYHLHKQLLDAAEYARENGVLLKGDIPIGVNRNGVDAWSNPTLFNMDYQTGAPPDDYAEDGQNWGFPTYNWEEMSKDGYGWWKHRLTHMSQYFDAYRIDHLLGFFRIWEIPYDAISGLLGHFSPAQPVEKEEFEKRGIFFDDSQFCEPNITVSLVENIFGNQADSIITKYLITGPDGRLSLKETLGTQRDIDSEFAIFSEMSDDEKTSRSILKKKLMKLLVNILFVRDKSNSQAYHPRIEIKKTALYQTLDPNQQQKLYDLYIDYFYKRQEVMWKKQAMVKLPALIDATDMLVCGEDLGMVPDCVPGVMEELGILGLRIQRMPKEEWLSFGIPNQYPYMSVCSPSCHDMSTVRGWWEEDRMKTQQYFNEILGDWGEAPFNCEPWVVEKIVADHLNSPSMWAVFPIQDFIGMDKVLRKDNPNDERINVPSNPKHYWRYRFHMNMEDLLEEKEFNIHMGQLIEKSGRNKVIY